MIDATNRQKSLFMAALDQPAEARAAYLSEACGGDHALRRQVEAMLQAHGVADSFLEKPAAAMGATVDLPATPAGEGQGSRIGPYKLLQQIGEGGMGVVWMAEQQEPVRRMVAVKIIKPGMDSAQVIARFEVERQALALMDHLNIARVLDAGATPSGRPFFVMELVHGIPIARFCDDHKLTPRQRLALFIPVCRAIQHAHQKGIIHRDIKPSNVLVTMYDDKPVPKIIDFGVAKAIDQRLTEKTLFTHYGALVGTFEYMSPEQAEMNALGVDTRSDIYALGVLLYELLTGTTPLERERVQKAGLQELVRLIKEEEPPQPSVRLSSANTLAKIAAARGTEPARLSQLVRGEIDWIVMKCLEKDRTRRYDTATALARDIERYLSDQPIEAGPPSAGYRLRKFVKRNRGAVTAACVVLLAVVLGIVGTTRGWVEAVSQRDDAIQARQGEADQVEKTVKALKAKAKAEEIARIAAQDRATIDKKRADEAGQRVHAVKAHLALEKGINFLEKEDMAGFLWLARALEEAPADEIEFKRSVRRLLGAWRAELAVPRAILTYPKSDVRAFEFDIRALALSPDGKTLATAGTKEEFREIVQLWDAKTARPVGDPKVCPFVVDGIEVGKVNALAFNHDGRQLLVLDWLAHVWDRDTDKWSVLVRQPPVGGPFNRGAFSPDGKWVVVANDFVAKVFSVETGKHMGDIPKIALQGKFDKDRWPQVVGLAIDGDAVVTALNRAPTAQHSTLDRLSLSGRTRAGLRSDRPRIKVFAASGDGSRLAETFAESATPQLGRGWVTTYLPDSIELTEKKGDWLGKTGRVGLPEDVSQLALNADGTKLVAVGASMIRAWDWGATTLGPRSWMRHPGPRSPSAVLSPDGKMLATANVSCLLWDLPPARKYAHISKGMSVEIKTFLPDGKTLIAVAYDDKGKAWFQWFDAASGIALTKASSRFPSQAALSPDGKYCATVDDGPPGSPVKLRHADGRFIRNLSARGMFTYWAISFSADGKSVMATGWDFQSNPPIPVKLHRWDVAARNLQEERDLKSFMLANPRYRFSPRGKYYYCAWDRGHTRDPIDGTVLEWWDAATGKQAGAHVKLPGLALWLPDSVVFSPDEKLLLTISSAVMGRFQDVRVRLWSADTGQALSEPKRVHWVARPVAAAFAPNGKIFAIAYTHGVQFWDTFTFRPLGAPVPIRPGAPVPLAGHTDSVNSVAFAPDGKSVALGTWSDGLYVVPTPRPLAADLERVRLWIEVATWRELDASGASHDLDARTWQERYNRLQKLGGPP
jgi:serine/threonine protein kinase/WD40 repeat protein